VTFLGSAKSVQFSELPKTPTKTDKYKLAGPLLHNRGCELRRMSKGAANPRAFLSLLRPQTFVTGTAGPGD